MYALCKLLYLLRYLNSFMLINIEHQPMNDKNTSVEKNSKKMILLHNFVFCLITMVKSHFCKVIDKKFFKYLWLKYELIYS